MHHRSPATSACARAAARRRGCRARTRPRTRPSSRTSKCLVGVLHRPRARAERRRASPGTKRGDRRATAMIAPVDVTPVAPRPASPRSVTSGAIVVIGITNARSGAATTPGAESGDSATRRSPPSVRRRTRPSRAGRAARSSEASAMSAHGRARRRRSSRVARCGPTYAGAGWREVCVQDVVDHQVVLLLEARVRDAGHHRELLVRVRQPLEELDQVVERRRCRRTGRAARASAS